MSAIEIFLWRYCQRMLATGKRKAKPEVTSRVPPEAASREVRMPDKKEPIDVTTATLPLKHGNHRVNVLVALSNLESMQADLEVRPRVFYDLLALARGQTKGVSLKSVEILHQSGVIDREKGVFLDHQDDLVLSAIREHGTEGVYLTDPFKVENEEDIKVVRAVESELERRGWGCGALVAILRGEPLPREAEKALRRRIKELDKEERRSEEGWSR